MAKGVLDAALEGHPQEVRLPMRERIWRGGMIGAGCWSEIQLTAWANVDNAEIVALCDRHPERLGDAQDDGPRLCVLSFGGGRECG